MKKPIITNVPPEKAFWFCNGQVAKNLKEFAAILEKIPQSVFEHHVNAKKNDFSRWIAGVFGQTSLAKQIEKAKSAQEIAKKINAKI